MKEKQEYSLQEYSLNVFIFWNAQTNFPNAFNVSEKDTSGGSRCGCSRGSYRRVMADVQRQLRQRRAAQGFGGATDSSVTPIGSGSSDYHGTFFDPSRGVVAHGSCVLAVGRDFAVARSNLPSQAVVGDNGDTRGRFGVDDLDPAS